MSTIVTRAGKGSPLTNNEVDANFVNLNTDKIESITSVDGSVVITPTGTTRDLSVGTALNTATLISQVRNETGATLTKGTVVYVSGASSNKALVSKALASADATSAQTYGVIQADIPNNQNGYVVVIGVVSGLNTSAFANGTQLYLSGTTAGTYTSTKPYAPIHLVYVGIVTYSHVNQGTIEVKIQNGYEMDELHNVAAQSPSNGQTLVYNTSTSLWEKNTVSLTAGVNGVLPTANGGTNLSSFTSGGVVYASSTSALATGSALTFDGTKLVATLTTDATTTYPAYFDNSGNGSGTGSRIGFRNAGASYGEIGYLFDGSFATIINSATSAQTRFLIGGTEALRLTSTSLYTASGINVGIGTSSPTEKLVVNGNARLLGGGYLQLFNSTNASNSGLATDATGLLLFSSTSVTRWLNNTLAVEQMRLDSANNLGLGTIPGAWAANSTAFQLKYYGSVWNNTDYTLHFTANGYYDGSSWQRFVTGASSGNYYINGNTHIWRIAAAGANPLTWTDAMTLSSSGRLGIGDNNPTYTLEVAGSGSFTTARVINGAVGATDGSQLLLGNSANYTNAYFRLNGGGNTSQAGAGSLNIGVAEAVPMAFYTANVERGRFSSTGLNVTGAITENNVAVVTQSDIGTAPNEIPLNQYLGSMAYQDGSAYYNTGMTVGFRNRIINGNMSIAQRTIGPVTVTTETYVLDRWNASGLSGPTCTVEQTSTAPENFVNSLKYTVVTGSALSSTTYSDVRQYIEGFNVADLGWGTTTAKPVTISFWVRCSVTGTFAVSCVNSAYNRCYPASYTINSANTWEYKTVTIAGDVTGTWLTTTSIGIRLVFDLGIGSTYSSTINQWSSGTYFGGTGVTKLAATTGATWFVTGVQLEKGNIATSFDVRPYGTELALCQRYCFVIRGDQAMSGNVTNSLGIGVWNGTNGGTVNIPMPVSLRTAPTSITVSNPADFQFVREALSWETASALVLTNDATGVNSVSVGFLAASDLRGLGTRGRTNSSTAGLIFNSEL